MGGGSQSIMKRLRFSILATVLGNTLEWYDLALYGLLAPLFATLFFPASSDFSFFSHPFIFLAIGGVARPLGALFFGVIGDRYGRKTAMIASIVLMVLPVLLIGGLPTYAQIGFTATILLALVPFIQGFCAGGEFSGSIVFLSETAPPKLRGATSSWAVFGFLIGMLLGAIDIYLLENHLSPEQFEAWGWRIPFLFGGFLALFAFFLRRMLHETPVFLHAQERGETAKSPIIEALKQHKKQVLQACGISFLDAVAFNTSVILH
jgi:MHS family proline/betaine transporter-like MFS transporter